MGVRGLMSFVEQNRHSFYDRERFCDSNLVIDGFGLIYALYFDEGRNGSLNGEFLELYQNIEKFFGNLAECNIFPFVIFDGPIKPDKLPCVVNRLTERVQDVHKLLSGTSSYGRLLPLFAVDALHHYLISNDIPMAVSLVDGDEEAVAVANHLNCPVLSQDSDYYVYNLKGGYLPFKHFQWNQIHIDRRSGKRMILCERYHISSMFHQFGVYDHMLPFLSVLLGNDWIDPSVFRELVKSFPLARTNNRHKSKKQKDCDQRMESVLYWLASKSGNNNAVFDKLFTHLRRTRCGNMMRKVEDCVAMYREPTDISETLKLLGIWKPRHNEHFSNPHQVIQNIVRHCRAHPSILSLLESNYVCLPVIVSDTQKSSPHDAANDIRFVTYRILFRQYRFPVAGPELLYLQEYDKIRFGYAKSKPTSVFTSQCVMCEQRHRLDQPCFMNGVRKFVMPTTTDILQRICPKISSFCIFAEKSHRFGVPRDLRHYLDLVMVSTVLWIYKTSPDSSKQCAIVAMIAWSFCHHLDRKSGRHKHPDEYDQKSERLLDLLHKRILLSASRRQEVIENELDIGFLHSVAQWLCILNAVVILHQVVDNPPTKFSIHHFFTSSTFLHEIHFRLTLLARDSSKRDCASFSRNIAGRLDSLPNIKNAFEIFSAFLTSK